MSHGANDAGHDSRNPQRQGSGGTRPDGAGPDGTEPRGTESHGAEAHGAGINGTGRSEPGWQGNDAGLQQPAQQDAAAQQPWSQPAAPAAPGQPTWGQQPAWGQQPVWGQPGPVPQQPTWAQPGQQPRPAQAGWSQQQWGQPAPGQPWGQPGQTSGQPAPGQAWGHPAPGQPSGQAGQQWGQPAPAQAWGQQSGPWQGQQGGGWPVPTGPGPYRGYVAPPKPGVIPLRPLGVGEILDGAFQAARKNAGAVFGTAVLLQVVVSALAWLVGGLIISAFGGLQVMANEELTDESAVAFGLSIIISSLVLGLLSSVGVLVLQGVLAIPTARAAVNQKTGFRLMFALAKGRIGALAVLGLLYLALTAVALVVIIAGSFFLADQLGVSSVWIIVLIILGLTAVSIWIGIKLMLAPAVIIMERAPLFRALARSWQLTNHSWWRTFGIILLCTIIVTVITSVVSMPISFIIGLAGPLMGDPTSAESMLATMGPLTLVSMLLSSIFSAIGYAFQAAVIALVYIDLRIRREGFDVVLLREHEASGGQDTRSIPGLGAGSAHGSAVPGRSGPWTP
ncbi:hypothetical protein E4J89_03145 [Arthrobacter sp. CAU 1506]|uniref:glycerophosphoryl diester phosphodiesterase membrane domain-containing protein n=1 Tax=Arthrobacter sp. CAU 1506 TaxID=2560052 RepID=UPI0010ABFF9F|nr:glycerophosphoryl diester phosphodiesterase membrane domain-containing protein [Arthrobacter sp. CAU 1506]TJY71277.1 hypothetical protein E4J89_03145 [Arthrobacter sp. CAU 1506]